MHWSGLPEPPANADFLTVRSGLAPLSADVFATIANSVVEDNTRLLAAMNLRLAGQLASQQVYWAARLA